MAPKATNNRIRRHQQNQSEKSHTWLQSSTSQRHQSHRPPPPPQALWWLGRRTQQSPQPRNLRIRERSGQPRMLLWLLRRTISRPQHPHPSQSKRHRWVLRREKSWGSGLLHFETPAFSSCWRCWVAGAEAATWRRGTVRLSIFWVKVLCEGGRTHTWL